MDVFAADLWEVCQGRAPQEYRDPETFFRKSYLTESLKSPLSVVERRLKGKGGDPVIQIQTPFGGGQKDSFNNCRKSQAELKRYTHLLKKMKLQVRHDL